MYTRVLVPLDLSASDDAVMAHVKRLAREHGSKLILIHVADGYVARYQKALNLADSEEMRNDRAYLEKRRAELAAEGIDVTTILETGEPATKVVATAKKEQCDLIAMATHGHRFLMDIILGSVASAVRHNATIPVLLLPVKSG